MDQNEAPTPARKRTPLPPHASSNGDGNGKSKRRRPKRTSIYAIVRAAYEKFARGKDARKAMKAWVAG